MKQKKRNLNIIVGLILGIIIVISVGQLISRSSSSDNDMIKLAIELNKNCPIIVDKETRLDSVIFTADKVLQYNGTLIIRYKDSIDIPLFEKNMLPALINSVKTDVGYKIYRDNKITFEFNYSDKNGKFITKFLIYSNQYSGQ